MADVNNTEELSLVSIVRNLNFDIKQNQLTSGPPPTLKYISLSKIAIYLWSECFRYTDLRLLKQKENYEILEVFDSYEKEISSKVNKLEIPVECKTDLRDIICFVKTETINYIKIYCYLYHGKKDILRIFFDNICWTQQSTINFLKTIIKIINISNLNIKDKYEIACRFCLEEEIRDIFNELPENIIKEFEEDESYSFTKFWTSYIRNDELPTSINEEAARSILLNYTIHNGNAICVQNIWEKFADEAAMERLMHFSDLCVRECPDALFYFVKHMTPLQLEASPSFHLTVLSKLLPLSRWFDVLPISNYLMKLFRTQDVNYNFAVIEPFLCQNYLEVNELLNIWNKFALHFKSDIENNIFYFYQNNFEGRYYCYDSTKRQCIIAKLLQGMTTSQNRSELIYNDEFSEFWIWLIYRFGIKKLKYFLNIIFKADEIFHYKENFLEVGFLELCTDLIIANKYEVLDEALIEFCAEENIKEFKRELVYKDNAYIFLEIVGTNTDDKTDIISILNKYLSWCFEGDVNEMKICRKNVFDVESELYSDVRELFFERLNIFVNEGKLELVKEYWKWFYYSTDYNITTSKEKWERIKKILCLISAEECFLTYMKDVTCHVAVKLFITVCFNEDESVEIKEEIQNSEDLPILINELIIKSRLEDAKNFLQFCYSSDINKIKNFIEIFKKIYGSSIMFELINSEENIDIIISILNWFNLSDESANVFKESFFEYIENKRKEQIENPELPEDGSMLSENDWKLFIEKVDKIF